MELRSRPSPLTRLKRWVRKRRSQVTAQRQALRGQIQQWLWLRWPGACLQVQDPALYTLFTQQTQLTRITTGFQFTEGPIWCPEQNCLLFSDIPANQIWQLDAHQTARVFRQPSQHANGLTRDGQGRLIACEHGSRQVTRTELDGSITLLAAQFQGKALNSPNDVVVKSDGSIYFTDPPYGITPQQQQQPCQGVYRIDPQTQALTLAIADFVAPNGLVFSPDEQRLYISDSSEARQHVRVFEVQPDGTLTGGMVFCDLKVDRPGVPDGMTCDRHGNLFCTAAGGVWIFSPTGQHLGTIRIPELPTNCTWGDADGQGLYITAGGSVYRIGGTPHTGAARRPHPQLHTSPLSA
jgi:gluconolactonase